MMEMTMEPTPQIERDRFTQTLRRLTAEVERLELLQRKRRGRQTTDPAEQEYRDLLTTPNPVA